ncbi:hypothetical protein F7725_007963 [Dissostichus mawsoni]|uniref:C-type lectin domain-containing protein n=1 Tax=Dissostichus mawsoni TaxID=36200 RepID=A0A7J5Y5W9_DISMA|nr:hypothetical protein F7725_007963 [Dissostichus mawsoni]
MDISAEVAKLQAAYDTAIWHRDEAKKQLAREIREQQITKWELDHQKSRSKDYLKLKEGCRHCLPGWTFMNSVCFYFAFSDAFSPRSWQEARQFCINQAGDLAVIYSREKHLAISKLITKHELGSPRTPNGYWIGLRDIKEEGIWKWLDGTRLTTGYCIGEGWRRIDDRDCAAMYPRSSPFEIWYQAPCHHILKWICQMTTRSAG